MAASVQGPATVGAIASAVLIVAGVVVWLTTAGDEASFGWFAYAPLANDVSMGPFFFRGQHLIAAGLVVLGLVFAAVALGFAWGRRAGRAESQTGPFSHPSAQ